ncbi:hypothetical protein [Streptomyces flavofungini]|uniref:hypothetical protein n=1 Tax=Streptomyces flavofungini TaxID=68200 RepID=UPI0025B234CA|nr:hypothetical protein [Streptomyces flavofungini]WJV51763.1 hypothetical protein QUY26_39745 [Streptomyces flavofungini]
MGVSSSYLSKAEVQRLLGVNAFGLWRLVRKYDNFPQPTEPPHDPFAALRDKKEPEEVWDGTQVSRWAAETPEFSHRGAVLVRPLPENPAPGRWAGYKDTVRGPALDWQTALGVIRIVHSDDRQVATDVASALAGSGNPDGVTTVCALYGDMGFHGPALVAADTAHPGIEYEASWGNVAALAGHDLPWWPDLLRLPQLIRQWQPGAPAAVAEVPPNENEKTLRRAARNNTFDTAARAAVTDMANSIRNNRIDHTAHDNEIFGREGYGERPNPVVIGAVPDTTRHPLPCDGDRQALKDGWHKLALSSHPDAVAALEVAVGRDPDLLPFGTVTEVPVQPGAISERWARRLTMCDPTAAHAVLAHGDTAEAFFIDPLTDMPVLRTPGDGGKPAWRFYAPLSLPDGGAELASVVLHHTVWATTSDGHVHPAPCTPTEHLWWGDGWGDRPSEAATVVDALLDDLGATINLREHWNAPKGLTKLFNEEHQHGAELTRSTLLHARMTPPRTR